MIIFTIYWMLTMCQAGTKISILLPFSHLLSFFSLNTHDTSGLVLETGAVLVIKPFAKMMKSGNDVESSIGVLRVILLVCHKLLRNCFIQQKGHKKHFTIK